MDYCSPTSGSHGFLGIFYNFFYILIKMKTFNQNKIMYEHNSITEPNIKRDY
jgi:hypothetical protein